MNVHVQTVQTHGERTVTMTMRPPPLAPPAAIRFGRMPQSEKLKLKAELVTGELEVEDPRQADQKTLARQIYEAYLKNFNMNKAKARTILTGKTSTPVSSVCVCVCVCGCGCVCVCLSVYWYKYLKYLSILIHDPVAELYTILRSFLICFASKTSLRCSWQQIDYWSLSSSDQYLMLH